MGASYTVKYFDCINPVAITAYKYMTACEHQTNKVDIQPETYLHSKIAEPPEVEIPEPISREDCRRLVSQQTFHTPDGENHPVQYKNIGGQWVLYP